MNVYAKRKDPGGLSDKMSKAMWCQCDSHLVDSVYGVGFIFGQFVCNLFVTVVVEETAIAPAKVVVEEEEVIVTRHLPNSKSAQTCRDVINFKYT